MTSSVYLYGKNMFRELCAARSMGKHIPIQKMYLTRAGEKDASIMSLVQSNALTYTIITDAEMDHLVGKDSLHQGVGVLIDSHRLYTPLAEVLQAEKNGKKVFVVLDHLEDPHNVGAIIRSSLAFGVDAIILPEHHQVHVTGTVVKASSGAAFLVPVVLVSNINAALLGLKEKGFWIYGLTGNGSSVVTETIFDENTVIVVGSEGDGISSKTLEHCDFKLSIPIQKECESLNASNAAAVVLYEWKRQNP